MDDCSIFLELIADKALIEKVARYELNTVSLEETKENVKFEIRGIPDDAFVIKLDKYFSVDSIFKGNHGECKRADFIIVSHEDKKIIYIEMKKSKDNLNSIEKQMYGAKAFILFCKSIVKLFWNNSKFLDKYKERFVIIHHIPMNKRAIKTDIKKLVNMIPQRKL